MIEISLPWPMRDLSPNVRTHWTKLSKARATYRQACRIEAQKQGLKKIDAESLHLDITFYPPSLRQYDLDNCLASIKSGLDGIADACGVDDSTWSLTIRKSKKQIGGIVKIIINVSVL